jgi:hypothetical protein
MKVASTFILIFICFILKTSLMAQSENEIWTAVCSQDPRGERLRCIEPLQGGFLVGGDKGISNERTIWILKLDAGGTILKDWEIPVTVNEVLAVLPVEDGRVVVAASWKEGVKMVVVSSEGLVDMEWELPSPKYADSEIQFVKMILMEGKMLTIGWNNSTPGNASRPLGIIGSFDLDGRLEDTIEVNSFLFDIAYQPQGALMCLTDKPMSSGRELQLKTYIPLFGCQTTEVPGKGHFISGKIAFDKEDKVIIAASSSRDSRKNEICFWSGDSKAEKITSFSRTKQGKIVKIIGLTGKGLSFFSAETALMQPAFYIGRFVMDIMLIVEEITSGIFYPADVCEDANGNYVIAGYSRRSVADFPEVICVRKK